MGALSPKTSAEQFAGAVGHQVLLGEVGVELTRLMSLTMRLTLFRSPTAACSVPIRSIAIARAAGLPSSVDVLAELADPGLAVLLGDVAGQEHQVAGRTKGT